MWWNAVFPEHETWRKSTWKGKSFLYSLLLWKKAAFKWFLVNFQSVSSFHEDSGKREVCGGNWPVDLYTAWEEFHPFLYPRFFRRYWMCQLEQPYLIRVLAPSLGHRLSSLSSQEIYYKDLHYLPVSRSNIQHTESITTWVQTFSPNQALPLRHYHLQIFFTVQCVKVAIRIIQLIVFTDLAPKAIVRE